MRRDKRSRVKGDRSIATPKPGPRCVALRVLVGTSVDVSDAPKTVTRTQRGVSDRRAKRSGRLALCQEDMALTAVDLRRNTSISHA